jgi:phage shock protein A
MFIFCYIAIVNTVHIGESQMFNQIITLVRGRSYETAEAALAPHMQTILRQQIRDCATSLVAARNAVAVATAQSLQEEAQSRRMAERLADLEQRTLQALELGKTELAHEAAESIAVLEQEREASLHVQATYKTEIARLKTIVRSAEQRLKDLERGQKLTDAAAKTQKLRGQVSGSALSTFKDAEETLPRLRDRQKHFDLTMDALDEMDLSRDPSSITEKLADAGCGPALKTRAEDVLKRLKDRTTPSSTSI